jgi:two-component sensor histidine kinase
LIIREFADNAIRHGALRRGAQGNLAIDWQANDDGSFLLTWREIGAGQGMNPRPRGFGTVIVRALLEKQLGGSIDRDWDDYGLTVTIRIPQTNPAESTTPETTE